MTLETVNCLGSLHENYVLLFPLRSFIIDGMLQVLCTINLICRCNFIWVPTSFEIFRNVFLLAKQSGTGQSKKVTSCSVSAFS